MNLMLWTKNDLKVSHGKQVNTLSNMKLSTSFINFGCQSCEVFVVLSYHQEDEAIYPSIFSGTVGLGNIIRKLLSSNFMVMLSLVSVIFDIGDNYSCSSNKGDFVKIEKNMLPRKIKGIAKGLESHGFGFVKYYFRKESGYIIALQAQAYYVSALSKIFYIISPQDICASERYKGDFISHCHADNDSYAELNVKEENQVWKKSEPIERVCVKYIPKNKIPDNEKVQGIGKCCLCH